MPFQRLFGLTAAIVLAAAGAVRAQNSTLEIDVLTSQLGECLGTIEQGESQVYGDARNQAVEPCLDFVIAFEEWRPERSGWDPQFDSPAATTEFVGAGRCFQAARLLNDADKMARLSAFLRTVWGAIGDFHDRGLLQDFHARANAFSGEVWGAASEPTRWETPPDAGFWNANCAGFFGTSRDDLAGSSPPAGFAMSATQDTITVEGVIGEGFAEALEAEIGANQFARQLLLSSVGGTDIDEAMAAGRFIRARGLHVRAVGNCESACTMLFVAGAMRLVGFRGITTARPGRLGFHRLSVSVAGLDLPIPEDSGEYGKVALYFREMGANPGSVLDFMRRNEGLAFYYPTLEELCAADVIGIPGAGPGLSMILGNESACEKFRFLDRYENYLRRPDLSDG